MSPRPFPTRILLFSCRYALVLCFRPAVSTRRVGFSKQRSGGIGLPATKMTPNHLALAHCMGMQIHSWLHKEVLFNMWIVLPGIIRPQSSCTKLKSESARNSAPQGCLRVWYLRCQVRSPLANVWLGVKATGLLLLALHAASWLIPGLYSCWQAGH